MSEDITVGSKVRFLCQAWGIGRAIAFIGFKVGTVLKITGAWDMSAMYPTNGWFTGIKMKESTATVLLADNSTLVVSMSELQSAR